MKRLLLFFLLLHLTGTQGFAQDTFIPARLDSLFDLLESHDKVMGSMAIHRDGKLIYQRAIGMASLEEGIRAHPATKYRIGSISKTFTAVMILQLAAEGRLRLDDRLHAFFPDIPKSGEITIAHLLRHRSGLVNFTDDPGYSGWLAEPRSRDQMLALFQQYRTTFKAGEQAAYSNTNYVLLTYILEKLEGKAYAEILRQRICRPLGLKATAFGGAIDPSAGEARSYRRGLTWTDAGETHFSIPMGAGGLVSTPEDLNLFFRALLRGEILHGEWLAEMTRIEDGFGMGLLTFPYGEKKSFGHTGGIDGFHAISGYFPEDDLAVSWTSNGLAWPMNNILLGALALVFGDPYVMPEFKAVYHPSEATLRTLEGMYSSPEFPLKITIRVEHGLLTAQASGQPEFPLEAHSDTEYRFDAAGVVLTFHPEDAAMTLDQGALSVRMSRETVPTE